MKTHLRSLRRWTILLATLSLLAASPGHAQEPAAAGVESTPNSTTEHPPAQAATPGKPATAAHEKTAKEKSPSSTAGLSAEDRFMAAAKKAMGVKEKKAGTDTDASEGDEEESNQPWNAKLVKFLSVSILAFGAAVLGMMTYLVMQNKDSGAVLRLFTVPLVIVASVFLVVAGFTNQQITPVVGLLGTIVGYILGSHSARNEMAAANEAAREKAEDKAGKEKDALPPTS
ncbi:MAG: hypothetical protein ABJF10_12075 [Chthoniobacter sp.]|uniref:hypothetical protein n=1 Tax=Chthoniobacter sp. TaxID=2510640 RepID=UPI0032A7149C